MQKKLIITMVLIFGFTGNIFGYETEWDDTKFKEKTDESQQGTESEKSEADKKAKKLNSVFKVDGNIWASYEFLDRSAIGTPDAPGQDKAGFKVGRARINFRGKVQDGFAKGIEYRITTETSRAFDQGDGCASSIACKEDNDYLLYVKDAYINIPLPVPAGKNSVRIGQQHTPTVENQGSYNQVNSSWAHRYLDSAGKAPWDEVGLSASRDIGLSFIHKNTYHSLHLMLGNGEGYHKPNAEGLNISNKSLKLEDIATGKSKGSYGYDLYGMVAVTPTGKNKDFIVNIAFPFRLHNVTGIDQSEYNKTSADITDITAPKYTHYRGNKRSLQDITYGVEGDVTIKKNDYGLSVGAGTAVKVDKASYAYKVDETVWSGVSPADLKTISSHYTTEEDRIGFMNYGFIHAKFQRYGVFARVITGSSGSKLDGKVSSRAENKSWVSKIINSDIKDGKVGNLTFQELYRLDNIHGAFQSTAYGVEYFVNERFKVAFGTRTVTGTDPYGKDFRQNKLEAVNSLDANYANVAEQVQDMSNPQYQQQWASLGYGAKDSPDLNDWIGKKQINREVFIRTEYEF